MVDICNCGMGRVIIQRQFAKYDVFWKRGILTEYRHKNNKSAVGSTALLLLKRGKFMKKIYKRKLCRFLFVYVYTIPFACDQIVSKFWIKSEEWTQIVMEM